MPDEELGQYPSIVAMRIAGVSQARFNEAVARGHYRCAPTEMTKAGRMFNVRDILALCIYAQFLTLGFTAREAAVYACNTRVLIDDTRMHIEEMIVTRREDGKLDTIFRAAGQKPITVDETISIRVRFDPIWKRINRKLLEAGTAGEL